MKLFIHKFIDSKGDVSVRNGNDKLSLDNIVENFIINRKDDAYNMYETLITNYKNHSAIIINIHTTTGYITDYFIAYIHKTNVVIYENYIENEYFLEYVDETVLKLRRCLMINELIE